MANVTLPTLVVDQATADIILAAFQAKYGTSTTAETVTKYKQEMAQWILDTIMTQKGLQLDAAYSVERATQMEALRASLPNPANIT